MNGMYIAHYLSAFDVVESPITNRIVINAWNVKSPIHTTGNNINLSLKGKEKAESNRYIFCNMSHN